MIDRVKVMNGLRLEGAEVMKGSLGIRYGVTRRSLVLF